MRLVIGSLLGCLVAPAAAANVNEGFSAGLGLWFQQGAVDDTEPAGNGVDAIDTSTTFDTLATIDGGYQWANGLYLGAKILQFSTESDAESKFVFDFGEGNITKRASNVTRFGLGLGVGFMLKNGVRLDVAHIFDYDYKDESSSEVVGRDDSLVRTTTERTNGTATVVELAYVVAFSDFGIGPRLLYLAAEHRSQKVTQTTSTETETEEESGRFIRTRIFPSFGAWVWF